MDYGFVYLWYDRKHKRYYLGKHWGNKDDGYVCSSPWMKRAFVRRRKDFKRKILQIVFDRDLLGEAEETWGLLIKESELGTRYYNLKRPTRNWQDDTVRMEAAVKKMTGRIFSEEHRKKLSEAKEGQKVSEETKLKMSRSRAGRKFSVETRQKLSNARKGKKFSPLSSEHKLKLSEANKAYHRG